ncbi:MAG: serine/threonine protein kinase, partial [Myxococcales bacterium]|nr:serine/threonine protein kinase [Myxococcales bacterium]
MEHDPTGATTLVGETTLEGFQEPAPPPRPLPSRLGRYVPMAQLGQGGMGVVHEAFDTELARRVAIKVLPGGRARQINAGPRLRREARALARLAHPNVVAIYDVGEADGTLFVAMELVEGQTLGRWQKAQPREWTEIVDAYLQAGEGLAAAHREGLVHRDFKPDNAVIDPQGRVRVLDFGLAIGRADEDEDETVPDDGVTISSRLTVTGTVMGTPAYMAPEQIAGAEADARSDQFSFCVALFEALYGVRPFAGRSLRELRAAIASAELAALPPERAVPAWLHRVVLRGLRADPRLRWPDLPALLRALSRGRQRARHRRWAILGGALLVAGTAALAAPRADAAAERCEAAARVEPAWGPHQREQARSAIAGRELPYAADTWSRVERGLDRYAQQWSAARQEACEAGPGDPMHDRWVQCLEDRRAELAALAELLGEADDAMVARAASAVERLPSIDACAALDGDAPPADPERSAEIRSGLARAHAFELAGRYAEGRAQAQTAADQAEALGDPAVIAQAQLRLGLLHERSGAYPEAEQALSRAAWEAAEHGDDDVAAQAMVQLTGVVGYLQARHDEGLAWGRHARAAVARAHATPHEQARLWNNLGATHDRAGELERARDHYAQALAALQGQDDDEARALRASTLNNLGNARVRLGDRDAAQLDLEAAVAQIEALRGPEHPDVAIMLANLANVELDRGALADAELHHRRALRIREHALGPEHPLVASSLLNLGVTLQALGRADQARPHLQRAVQLKEAAVGAEHPETALALNNLGEALRELGEAGAALELHRRAIAIVRATLGEDHPLVAFGLTNLGLDLLADGRPREAIETLEAALAQRERSGAEPALRGVTRLGLARAVAA